MLFAVAPAAVVLTLGSFALHVPLRARWALSKGAFEEALDRAPPPTAKDDWVPYDVPSRFGAYRIRGAFRVGDAVIFYEETGAGFDDAGFAWLPTGPFDELDTGWFESPQFWTLEGHWYTWWASW